MLKGKIKQKFNNWYYKQVTDKNISKHAVCSFFESLHFLLQYGMIEAFLNKHGLFPYIVDTLLEDPDSKNYDPDKRYHTVVRTHEKWLACGFHKSKIDAQKEAIKVSVKKFNLKYQ